MAASFGARVRRSFNVSRELTRARFAPETRRLRRDRKLAKCEPHRPGLSPEFPLPPIVDTEHRGLTAATKFGNLEELKTRKIK